MNIYLASPYSHKESEIRRYRFEMACKKAAEIMSQGHSVFSPIAHSHPISLHMDNSLDHDFWLNQDLSFLDKWADEVWVMKLPGWDGSKGIQRELAYATQRRINIRMVMP